MNIPDRDTITHTDRFNRFNCIFDCDKGTIFISRTVFHFPDLICAFGAVKNGSNGATFTEYDDLSYGVNITCKATKQPVCSVELQGPIKSDQKIFEEYTISGFYKGDGREDLGENNRYTATFWFTEGGTTAEKTVEIVIMAANTDTAETMERMERSDINKMIYLPGYYPTDDEWESHQKYLEDGETRPVAE